MHFKLVPVYESQTKIQTNIEKKSYPITLSLCVQLLTFYHLEFKKKAKTRKFINDHLWH